MNTQRAKGIEQRGNPTIRALRSALCTMRKDGFTYLVLLAAIIIIGISMGAAGKYWQNILQREKEEELLFRGDQYVKAIERYYSSGAQQMYPQSIDDLLKDNRTATGKRYLRQKYKDPITGEDFVEFRDKTKANRITGVYSSSNKEPLKQSNFPTNPPYFKDFEGKKKYSEWRFVYSPR